MQRAFNMVFFFFLAQQVSGQLPSLQEMLSAEHKTFSWSTVPNKETCPNHLVQVFIDSADCPLFAEMGRDSIKKDIQLFAGSGGARFLVYSGICDPYTRTFIFEINENSLKKIYDAAESIREFSFNGEEFKFTASNPPLGCIPMSEYSRIQFPVGKKISKAYYRWDGMTELPEINSDWIKMKAWKGGSLLLRTSPKVDNVERENPCTDALIDIGNQSVSFLPREIQQTYFCYQKNNWFFVMAITNSNVAYLGWAQLEKVKF